MNIGVIGGGSLGLLISSYLAKHHDVTLYVKREAQQREISAHGLHLYNQGQFIRRSVIDIKLSEQLTKADYIFVCVKQPYIIEVISKLGHIENSRLVFLQNGMGHIEAISQLNNKNVLVGVVEHGANRIDDFTVNHLGQGIIKLASLYEDDELLDQTITSLHQSDFPFIKHRTWQDLLQEKLIINAVINPITALFDIANGQVVQNDYYCNIAKKITEETAKVLQIEREVAWKNVKRVSLATKDNISSMRSDFHRNQQTEIEAILGYIVQRAQKQNLSIPYIECIYLAVLGAEKEKLS